MPFKKKLTIIIIILSIQSIFNLSSKDLCSSLVCKGKLKYKCAYDLCSLNSKTCDEYILKIAYAFRSLNVLQKFQESIQSCDISSKIQRDNYCVKNTKCFRNQAVWTLGFKTLKQKVACICEGKYKYKCGDDYCTSDNQYCDLLQLRIKYQKKFNKSQIKNCNALSL
jgi:hypothetical protein